MRYPSRRLVAGCCCRGIGRLIVLVGELLQQAQAAAHGLHATQACQPTLDENGVNILGTTEAGHASTGKMSSRKTVSAGPVL